jgi:BMFP domain-containing protein YqiC
MTLTTIEKRIVQLEQTVREMQQSLDYQAAVEGIRRGLDSVHRGEGESAKQVFARIRRKHSKLKKR